jgi:hypothetical protein
MKKKILIKQIREIRKPIFSKISKPISQKNDFLSIEKSHARTRKVPILAPS